MKSVTVLYTNADLGEDSRAATTTVIGAFIHGFVMDDPTVEKIHQELMNHDLLTDEAVVNTELEDENIFCSFSQFGDDETFWIYVK